MISYVYEHWRPDTNQPFYWARGLLLGTVAPMILPLGTRTTETS